MRQSPSPLTSKLKTANTALIVDGNLDTIPDYFTPDYVAHLTDGEELTGGHAAIRRVVEMYHRAFADLEVEVEILVEGKDAKGDDRIAWQRTLRAVHQGNFKGFPATGRPIVWREMLISRFNADGLIAEEWVVSDLAERLLLARKS